MRALVVEDNAALSRVIAHTLRGRGFHVESAADGAEAWDIAQAEAFDLVVTDHQMPKMTGLEFADRLKDSELNANVPVILLTAKGLEFEPSNIYENHGVAEMMIKPFSPAALGETAARYAGASAAQ